MKKSICFILLCALFLLVTFSSFSSATSDLPGNEVNTVGDKDLTKTTLKNHEDEEKFKFLPHYHKHKPFFKIPPKVVPLKPIPKPIPVDDEKPLPIPGFKKPFPKPFPFVKKPIPKPFIIPKPIPFVKKPIPKPFIIPKPIPFVKKPFLKPLPKPIPFEKKPFPKPFVPKPIPGFKKPIPKPFVIPKPIPKPFVIPKPIPFFKKPFPFPKKPFFPPVNP